MIIYKVTNKINGKVYIGQTRKTLEIRKRGHARCSLNPHTRFHYAIRKYGIDNFEWEIICHTNNKSILNELEIFYIKKYDSTNFNKGYNMICGGDSNIMDYEDVKSKHDSIMRSDEVRKKISDTMKRKALNGELFTEEHRRKISASLKGKKYSDERRAKCDTRSVGCYCIVDNQRYDFHSYLEAGKWWYENYKPFPYSECVYQRKIKQSIMLGYCTYGRNHMIVDNVRWYKKEGDANEKVTD